MFGKKYTQVENKTKYKKNILIIFFLITFIQYYLTGVISVIPNIFNQFDDLILIIIVSYILITEFKSKNKSIRIDYLLVTYLLFLSFIVNGFKITAFLMSLNDFFHFFMYYLLFSSFFKDDLKKVINFLGYFSAISTVLALYQFLTFVPGQDLTQRLRWDSAVGFFGGGAANTFSIFNGIVFFIILSYRHISLRKKIIFLLFNITGLMLGCSKMGILVFFLVFGCLIIFLGRKNKKIVCIGVMFLIILFISMNKYFSEEFDAIKSVGDIVSGQITSTSSGRLSWVINYNYSIKDILLGDGPGQVSSFAAFRTDSDKLKSITPDGVFGSTTECDLITIFIEYGFVVGFLFVYLLLRNCKSRIILFAIIYCILVSISSRIFQVQYTSLIIGFLMCLKSCSKGEFLA